jgi:hypothetical protein
MADVTRALDDVLPQSPPAHGALRRGTAGADLADGVPLIGSADPDKHRCDHGGDNAGREDPDRRYARRHVMVA